MGIKSLLDSKWLGRLPLLFCVIVFTASSVYLTLQNSAAASERVNSISKTHRYPISQPNITSSSSSLCQESFEPKCDMYPYVKFWNKRFKAEDCFQSPLRRPISKVPLDKQKFLVFEPDRGGWNNIR